MVREVRDLLCAGVEWRRRVVCCTPIGKSFLITLQSDEEKQSLCECIPPALGSVSKDDVMAVEEEREIRRKEC